jgi:mono/diheme cytochrome c family protein
MRFSIRVFATLAVTACGTDSVAPDPTQPPAIYLAMCASCHGDTGAGTELGPQIQEPVRGYATYVIRNGRGRELGFVDPMAAFDTAALSDDDLSSILTFLNAQPRPTDGAGLYTRFCGNCHGANAQGGRVGKDITREGDELVEAVREGHHAGDYGDRTEYMPAWSTGELSSREVAAIEAYIGTLPPGPGGDDGDDD